MPDALDRKAFHQFTYGLFLLTTRVDGRDNACIINTALQAGAEPRQVSIACVKGSCTQELIDKAGQFNVSVLTEETPLEFFNHFGAQSGHDVQKFPEGDTVEVPGDTVTRAENGLFYATGANAFFACKVVERIDIQSHVMYVGEVQQAVRLSDEPSISYGFYQSVTRKKNTPAAAPTGEIVGWRCTVCGYVYEGAELPADFICPICKHGAEDFEPIYNGTDQVANNAADAAAIPAAINNGFTSESETIVPTEGGNKMKWVCKVCGYVHEVDEPPAECPTCKAPASQFEQMDENNMTLAAEHVFGVYGQTVKDNPDISDEDKQWIFDQLMANFNGECSEVGMYLCMARIAHRAGLPEVGLYWEKAAFEEAEHAAKFAELLGSDLEANMKDDTKANLAWRVDCEFGATAGKTELAAKAKQLGLDAIHDTVHEMARDEARHGKALKGLLERYF